MSPTRKDLLILLTMWVSPATLLLLMLSLYLIQPKVEAKLVSHVKSVLAQHNIKADVSFSGRDGILRGRVASQEIAENAHKLSLAVFGTRIIKNRLIVDNNPQNKATLGIESPRIKKASYKMQPTNPLKKAAYQKTTATLGIKNNSSMVSEINKIMLTMSQKAVVVPAYKPKNKAVSLPIAPLITVKKTMKKVKQAKLKPKSLHYKIAVRQPNKDKTKQSKPHTDKRVLRQPIKNENKQSKPKKRPTKVALILPAKKKRTIDRATKKKEKKKNVSVSSSKNTNNVLAIIDDFNFSLGAIAKGKTKKKTTKRQTIATNSPALEKIDLSSIHFSNATSTTLPTTAHQVLNKIARFVKKKSYPSIELVAYANDSDIAYSRGTAIRAYLVKQGLRKNSIHVAGHMMKNTASKHASFRLLPR
jgi:outer membrane protein OmpA-like peptidoglycan-associated protein